MTNFLAGAEYRFPRNGGIAFNPQWTEWMAIEYPTQVFPEATQFRMKPVIKYAVASESTSTVFDFEDDALNEVAEQIRLQKQVTLTKREVTGNFKETFSGKNLQFRNLLGELSPASWQDFSNFNPAGFGYAWNVEFRIRPDYQYEVNTLDGPVSGKQQFDDLEEVIKYVDNRLRTNGLDFSVKKVKNVR